MNSASSDDLAGQTPYPWLYIDTGLMTPTAEIRKQARELAARCRSLQLATLDEAGIPHASYAPFYRDPSGSFYIYVSTLSAHTRHLGCGRASILLIEDESRTNQIYARKRLGFQCAASFIDRGNPEFDRAIRGLAGRHGEIVDTLCQLSDFLLCKLDPEKGTFVKGFGQAYSLDPALEKFEHLVPEQA